MRRSNNIIRVGDGKSVVYNCPEILPEMGRPVTKLHKVGFLVNPYRYFS